MRAAPESARTSRWRARRHVVPGKAMQSLPRAQFLRAQARNAVTRARDRWPRGSRGQSQRIAQPDQAVGFVLQPKSCVDVRSHFQCTARQSLEASATDCGGELAGTANPGFREVRASVLPEST